MNAIKAIVLLMLVSLSVNAMDMPVRASKNDIVYVKTSDNKIVQLERWIIHEMKTLLVLLEHQRGKNSYNNPLQLSMLTARELDMLSKALMMISVGQFDAFYAKLIEQDRALLKPGQTILSLDTSALRTLINAAERSEARGVSAFCLGLFMPPDMQKKQLVPYFIDGVKNVIHEKFLFSQKSFLLGHPASVQAVAFSPSGKFMVSVCDSKKNNVIVWNMVMGKSRVLVGHPGGVMTVACSPDSNYVVSGCMGSENNLIVWDLQKEQSHVLAGHSAGVTAVAFSPDGKFLVSGDEGNKDNLILWDLSTKTPRMLHILPGHPASVETVAFSPDGKLIVSGCFGDRDNLIVWNPLLKTSHILEGHSGGVNAVAFSPHGNYIVSGGRSNQNNVILWDLATKTPHLLIGHPASVEAVAFSPEGQFIVSCCMSNQNNIIVWNVATGQQLHSLIGHASGVRNVAFSPDGRYIASASLDPKNGLIVWNGSTGEFLWIEKHFGGFSTVAFSPDGRSIIAGRFGISDNLMLFGSLTLEEEVALNNCTFAQAQFLYEVTLASMRGFKVVLKSPSAQSIFKALSPIIKQMLQSHFDLSIEIECPPKSVDCVVF